MAVLLHYNCTASLTYQQTCVDVNNHGLYQSPVPCLCLSAALSLTH